MKNRLSRAGVRGMCMAFLLLVVGLLALPAMAQVTPGPVEGTVPAGQAGVVRALAAGGYHACALRWDRTVTCWGANDQGQSLPPPERFVAVASGQSNSCGVAEDGRLLCWGANYQGQSAPPPGTYSAVVLGMAHGCALQTSGEAVCWGGGYGGEAVPPAGPFVRLSAGFHHTCGLRGDGQVECWGDIAPVPVGPFVSITSGAWHACGVREGGSAVCWGNAGPEALTPPATETFTTISAGYDHTCGLTADGRVRCWGYNNFGQTLAPGGRFVAVESGAFFTCAVRREGPTECWGSSHYGESSPPYELAQGVMPIRPEGVAPGMLGKVALLTSGMEHSCALLRDGRAVCWGRNQGMVAPPPQMRFTTLAAGAFHTCGIRRDDGITMCWGDVSETSPPLLFTDLAAGDHFTCGLRADGQATCWDGPYQGRQVSYGPYVSISAGGSYACGVRSDGQSECWSPWEMQPTPVSGNGGFMTLSVDQSQACGIDPMGMVQCGPPTNASWYSPVFEPLAMVSVGPSRACGLNALGRLTCWNGGWYGGPLPGEPVNEAFAAISMGAIHACALRLDGTVACWGDNYAGQATPPRELSIAASIDAGDRHTCAVRDDGAVACWGDNGVGQAAVPPGAFVSVGSGDDFSCGLADDGHVACWGGDNAFGQRSPPFEPFRQISIGRRGGCGVTRDGYARCWGVNGWGQPPSTWIRFKQVSAGFEHSCGVREDDIAECWGNGNFVSVPYPGPGVTWQSVQAGDQHSCGLRSDGVVQCWGSDAEGQVGMAPTGYFRALSVGPFHNCAIRTDGRVACWGANWSGQGMPPEGTFVAVSAGGNHTCAINAEGAYECWGKNDFGQAPPRAIVPPGLPALGVNRPFDLWLVLIDGRLDPGGWGAGGPPVPGTFHIAAGELPSGMAFSADGRISGMPTSAGTYSVTVAGVDPQGFGATRTFNILVDGTPPVVEPYYSWPAPMFNGWYTGNITITWYPYDVETSSWVVSGCMATTFVDTPGTTVGCTAESAGGVTSRSVTIKRDATAPETSLSATPAAVTNRTDAQFAFAGSDATAGVDYYECSLDGAAFAACTSPQSLLVSAGSHTFQVRAVDKAGHRDATPASHTWLVDATPPVVTPSVIGTLGSNGWYVGDVQISWTVGDAESAVTSTSGCNTVTLSSDTMGAGFTCTATSGGGTTVRTVTVKRDTVAPTVAISRSPIAADGGIWVNASVTVQFACADALSGVAPACIPEQVFSNEGQWTSTPGVAVDAAGNRRTSGTITVGVDRTAPVLAPTVGSGVVLLNSAATASANASDALSGVASQGCATPDTATVGDKAVACEAYDVATNRGAAGAAYRVTYGWQGYSAPVANPTTLNVIKAGRSIPFRWRLVDAAGAGVPNLPIADFAEAVIACPTGVPTQRISTYGGTSLALKNFGNGYYGKDRPTYSSYRGSCRRFDLYLGDGEVHSAVFKFD